MSVLSISELDGPEDSLARRRAKLKEREVALQLAVARGEDIGPLKGQMVGKYYVPPALTQRLGKMWNDWDTNRATKDVSQEKQLLAQLEQKQVRHALQQLSQPDPAQADTPPIDRAGMIANLLDAGEKGLGIAFATDLIVGGPKRKEEQLAREALRFEGARDRELMAQQAQEARAAEAQARREWEAQQNAQYRRTAEQLNATANARGSGGNGPRDRYSVQQGPDGRMFRVNLEDGTATPINIQGGDQLSRPQPAASEAERSSAGYLGRMEAVEGDLVNAKPLPIATQLALSKIPSAGNFLLDDDQQATRQKQMDWVRAKLRKESGAVISEKEMDDEIRTYFPMPGDGPKALATKAQARAQAREQLKSSAGRAEPTRASQVSPTPIGIVKVNSAAEAALLPAGTKFQTPDGRVITRK